VAGPLSAQDLPSNGCVVSSARLDADFVYRLNGGQYSRLFTDIRCPRASPPGRRQ
jgi:hypothetical protein